MGRIDLCISVEVDDLVQKMDNLDDKSEEPCGKDTFLIDSVTDDEEASKSTESSPNKELNVVPQEKNWKGIVLSIVVISIVCVLIGVSAYLLQPPDEPVPYKYTYDFDAMFNMSWRPFEIKGEWIGDNLLYQDRYRNLMRRKGYDEKKLIGNETMEYFAVYKVSVSPDFKYALLMYNVEKIYRHSTLARYSIYTMDTGDNVRLHAERLQFAAWGMKGSQLTYVLDNDLYYKSDVDAAAVAITDSGKYSNGRISNGIADWIYEEEMFADTRAHWTSKDGSYIAYVTFNDTQVPQIGITVYDIPYPSIQKVNYPKAGFPNPTVTVLVYDVESQNKIHLIIPDAVVDKDPILNSFLWIANKEALVTWSNRYQNISVVTHCSVPANFRQKDARLKCKEVYKEEEEGWIEGINRLPLPGPNKSFFRLENRNILLLSYITRSNSAVSLMSRTSLIFSAVGYNPTKLVGYNARTNRVYFVGFNENPMERHLYSVNISESSRVNPICHTCDEPCGYVDVTMPNDASYALMNCLGPTVPFSKLLKMTEKRDELGLMLEANTELRMKVQDTKMPAVTIEPVTIVGELGTYEFQAKLYYPPNVKHEMHIPVLLHLYAGPGSQLVTSQFSLDWITYLVTMKDIAVVTFDGRGSAGRGPKVLKEVSRRLGIFEIEDQITALRKVMARHPKLDKKKVAVYGWSYGGYAAMRLATHPRSLADNLTKCVVAVAPVTDWRLYDSMYTERYMGSPKSNHYYYKETSLLDKAALFRNFKLLLIHGTKDDNVHFQNSAVLERELVREGIMHKYQVYTDEAHSLSNDAKYTHVHLFKTMTQFLTDCYNS